VWPSTLEGVQTGEEVLVYAELEPDAAMHVRLGKDESITPVEIAATRPLLERAWVRANIERLQAQRSALAKDEIYARTELDKHIVALSTEFRVLSELTALLVLETEEDYRRFGIRRDALADILTVNMLGVTLAQRTELAIPPRPMQHSGFSPAGPQLEGQLGLLAMIEQPSGHFLASPYGAAFAVGSDDEDVWGGLTGTEIGEAYGIAGLGLVGTGRGGGGPTDGTIALGNTGLIGRGGGTRSFHGGCAGAGFGCRVTPVPRVRQGKAKVEGALDKDIIRRIVRAHINEIRHCYNQGLVRNPSLEGRFAVQFAITSRGVVAAAVVESSTLRDDAVAQCGAKAVKRWKFPKPESGNVVVTYPFVLEPGDGPTETPVRAPEPMPSPPMRSMSPPIPAGDAAVQAAYSGSFEQVMVALAEGRTGDALATTLAWREADAGNVLALVALGEVAEAVGDRKTAARAYGSIIDLHPARADLRRYAGARLERLGGAGLELATDTYAKALASRPDHPSSHRAFAYAALKRGRHREAFETLVAALQSTAIRWDRFASVREILAADLGIVGAAWLAAEPSARTEIEAALAKHHGELSRTPSTRFVLTWETDANDVDFHIEDTLGGHASYANRGLPSGGELFADITTGYGPECFAIAGTPTAGPYTLWAHYYSRGPMGFGMGKLQIVVHDGHGGVQLEDRPFVIMESGGRVELGTYTADAAARLDAGAPAPAH
jgi:tetratricopeptide (TPR) repeat protein